VKNPKRFDEQRCRDMLEGIEKIERWATRGYGEDDDVYRSAVIRELAVIGEAAQHLSERFKAARPEILWAQIAGLRNTVVHQYWDTKWSILEAVVHEDIPLLRETLSAAIGSTGTPPSVSADSFLSVAGSRSALGLASPQIQSASRRPRCGKWMTQARAYCGRPAKHKGACKQRP
jgi:uncharacterized protein with HEPN domain